MGRSILALALGLLAAASDRRTEPLDGGYSLDFTTDPDSLSYWRQDECARRERGGWHRSTGHCEPMLPAREMKGVFITAFEERSFFEGDESLPDGNDPRRFGNEIELSPEEFARVAESPPPGLGSAAYLLTFVGRRMREPYFVNCDGTPDFVWVVERLRTARYLGPGKRFDVKAMLARPVTVAVRHKGRWGKEEAEAVLRCIERG
ncbi:MAG TPA: hypothetical protein VFP12_15555 [Allosphingosinicella sp.]|nr:hypothetical protein [Allosphingosinicella sp.]